MSGSTEWELLVVAEDLEPGDTLRVETGDGEEVLMVLSSSWTNLGVVILIDEYGRQHHYNTLTLEEREGDSFILGKSEEHLSLRRKRC